MEFEIVVKNINPVEIFKENGLDPVLGKIKEAIDAFVPDVSTPAGRKAIASFARKIASSKTFIESAGKTLVADQKALIKVVDAERKRSRDTLDARRDQVRQPLTDWEKAEAERIAAEKLKAEVEAAHGDAIAENIMIDREREIARKEAAIKAAAEEQAKKAAAEAARIEAAKRDELLKKEAAGKATAAAEAKAQAIIDAAKRKEWEAAEALKRVEAEKILQAERAKAAQEYAVKKANDEAAEVARKVEADRIAKELKENARAESERKAAEAKAADINHREEVDAEIIYGIMQAGVSDVKARDILTAISLGRIPYLRIAY